jgi:hypothetical protein
MDWITHGSIPGKRFFSSKHPTSSGVYPASYSVGMREALSLRGDGQRDCSLCLMPYMPLGYAQVQLYHYLFYIIFTLLDVLKVYLIRNFLLTFIHCYTVTVGTP